MKESMSNDTAFFPTTKQNSFRHGDICVNVVSMAYVDYNYVVITHLKKLGTVVTWTNQLMFKT